MLTTGSTPRTGTAAAAHEAGRAPLGKVGRAPGEAAASNPTRAIAALPGPVAVWLAGLCFFVAYYAATVPAAQIVLAAGHQGWHAGAILGAFGVAALIGRPLSGRAVDRHGAQRVALAGGMLAAAGGALFGLSSDPAVMTAARVVQALGYVAFSTAVTAMAGGLASPGERAVALARSATAANIAIGVAPGLVQVSDQIAIVVSWAAALSVLGGAIACFLVRHTADDPGAGALAHGMVPGCEVHDPARPSVGHLHRIAPIGGAVLAGFVFAAFMQFGGLAAREHAGGLFALYGAAIVGIRFGFTSRMGDPAAPALAFLILSVGLLLLALPATWPAASLVIAAGFATLYPSLMARHITLRPDAERGRAVATYYFFSDGGFALASWFLPVVLQARGLSGLFEVAAAAAFVGALLFVRPRKISLR